MTLPLMNNHNNSIFSFPTPNQQFQHHQLHHQRQQQQTGNQLSIAYWNAAGVTNKTNELEAYMSVHNIDVMMVTETRIKPNNATTLSAGMIRLNNISGYHCSLAARPTRHRSGGVATLIRNNLKYMMLQPIVHEKVQCAPVMINLNPVESIIIAPIYCPPQLKWTESELIQLLEYLHKLSKGSSNKLNKTGLIVCGDWNAKNKWWGNIRACKRGKLLMNIIHELGVYNVLATGGATHFPYDVKKRPSAIDFAIYAGIASHRLKTLSTSDLDSDHLPIQILLALTSNKNNNSLQQKDQHLQLQQQLNSRNLRSLKNRQSIKIFQKQLNDRILLNTEINSCLDIEDAIQILNRNIYESAESAANKCSNRHNRAPLQQQQTHQSFVRGRQRSINGPYASLRYDNNFQQLMETKQAIKRLHLRIRNVLTLHMYKQCYKNLRRILRTAKANHYINLFSQINPDDRFNTQKMWKITNSLKRQPIPNLPLRIVNEPSISDNGNLHNCKNREISNNNASNIWWTKTTLEKAEAFASYLEKRFTPIHSNTIEERNQIETERATILELKLKQQHQLNMQKNFIDQPRIPPPFLPIRYSEVTSIIKKLPRNKSPGNDGIDNKVIKILPLKAILYLVLIFNSIMRLGCYPKQWKQASIKMILKPGKKSSDVSSYRPISLLPGFSKIFERLLMNRMFNSKEFANALPTHQFGFRVNHGTEQQLSRVSQYILKAYEEKQYCSAIFIDVKEAFDRVYHQGLLNKLCKLLPLPLYHVLEHYLTERTFHVKCNDGIVSRIGNIKAGVPQGSVLGPILYTIFTSDMPLPISKNWTLANDNSWINRTSPYNNLNTNTIVSTFADDTVIMSASNLPSTAIKVNKLYLDDILKWAKRWCISINEKKTAHVLFTNRRLQITNLSSMPIINNHPIANKTKHQYLGLHMDAKLNMRQHITQLRARLTATTKKYDWIIGQKSKLPMSCKIIFFKQCIASIWRYAIPIWGALASDTQFNRVETRNNYIIRKISKSTRYTRNKDIKERHKLLTANETFNIASLNFANTLAVHPNKEARMMITNPYIPNRLNRPRYHGQLDRYILPLQRQTNGQQKHQPQQPDEQHKLPTLLQLQYDECQKQLQQQRLLLREQQEERRRLQPVQQLNEYMINILHRGYTSGQIPRDDIERRIQGQPWQIQQLILPDLHPENQQNPIILQTHRTPERLLYLRNRSMQQRRLRQQLMRMSMTNVANTETVEISDEESRSPIINSNPPAQQ